MIIKTKRKKNPVFCHPTDLILNPPGQMNFVLFGNLIRNPQKEKLKFL